MIKERISLNHVCTRRCLAWNVVHGRTFYYCKIPKNIPMKKLEGPRLTLVRILAQLSAKGYITINDGRIVMTAKAREELKKDEPKQQHISFE